MIENIWRNIDTIWFDAIWKLCTFITILTIITLWLHTRTHWAAKASFRYFALPMGIYISVLAPVMQKDDMFTFNNLFISIYNYHTFVYCYNYYVFYIWYKGFHRQKSNILIYIVFTNYQHYYFCSYLLVAYSTIFYF